MTYVRLYSRGRHGQLQDLSQEFELAAFAGVCPSVGDRIVDPGAPVGANRDDPVNRTIMTVVARYFQAKSMADYVVLIVEERQATREEVDLL
jgi:hypothetical protein